MGCLLILLAAFLPRVAMVFIYLLTHWFSVFSTVIWPLLGFIFMPYTTLAYMLGMVYNHHEITGAWLVVLVIAVLVDLGSHKGSYSRTRRF